MPSRLPLYGTIATLALTRIAFGFQLQTVATLGPDLMLALALDFAALGGLIGAYLAPGVFVALPSGFLARRFGDRAVAVGSAWLIALGGGLAAAGARSVGRHCAEAPWPRLASCWVRRGG